VTGKPALPLESSNRVKAAMRAGEVALIGYAGELRGPTVVELIGLAGCDGVRIDLEHSALDLDDVQVKILAAERMVITPIVKVPSLDPALIGRLLAIGAGGISAPQLRTIADVKALIDAVRYPPLGNRGIGVVTRATRYGTIPVKHHLASDIDDVLLLVVIEDAALLPHLEDLVALEGIDVIAVGPADLGSSLGVGGMPNHPNLSEAIERIASAVRGAEDKYLSISVGHSMFNRTLEELQQLGVRYTNLAPAPEVRLLRSLTSQVEELRATKLTSQKGD